MHEVDQPRGDGQSQAAAAEAVRVIEMLACSKAAKIAFCFSKRDADPRIANGEVQVHLILGRSFPPDVDVHFPVR